MKYSDRTRLFDHLVVKDQKRQIIINSGADDDFFVNLELGALPIDQAIVTYLLDEQKERHYDCLLLLDRQGGSTIKRPLENKRDISAALEHRAQSVDRKQAGRASVSFDDDEEDTSKPPHEMT